MVLGYVNTRIILSLLFYVMLTPIGVVRRLFGDPMNRSLREEARSQLDQTPPRAARSRTLRAPVLSAGHDDYPRDLCVLPRLGCLLGEDGEIVAAAQEERFTRKKHDADFPRQAVDYAYARGTWSRRRSTMSAFTTSRCSSLNGFSRTLSAWHPRAPVVSHGDACVAQGEALYA